MTTLIPTELLIRQLATMKAGRNIVWVDQSPVNGSALTAAEVKAAVGNQIPSSDEGFTLDPFDGDTPTQFFWRIQTRRGALISGAYRPRFQLSVEIENVVSATLYRLTVDDGGGAVNCDYTSDADATLAEIITGLKAAIDAQITAQGWALATKDASPAITIQSDETVDGWTHQNYAMGINNTTNMALDTDASTCTFEVWYLPSGLTAAYSQFERYQFPDGTYTQTVTRNASGVVDIPGCSAAKLVITDTDGLIQPSIGVAKIES